MVHATQVSWGPYDQTWHAAQAHLGSSSSRGARELLLFGQAVFDLRQLPQTSDQGSDLLGHLGLHQLMHVAAQVYICAWRAL
jgi:hypothetical protein